jgi:hypothetical protein
MNVTNSVVNVGTQTVSTQGAAGGAPLATAPPPLDVNTLTPPADLGPPGGMEGPLPPLPPPPTNQLTDVTNAPPPPPEPEPLPELEAAPPEPAPAGTGGPVWSEADGKYV